MSDERRPERSGGTRLGSETMAYEALYRRYRPSRFADAFFGQEHVVAALRNAVEGDRVGHAYMFSGPRGTGKTTSARILAKALNCTNLQGGEPCDECDSCLAFQSGGSYDLHELDAASNNGVDAMRDLIGKVALGSPGRNKVYILDEVHMLSSGAENALLKTLEEPPPHVTFVLCTTEPNKVVPTIRSRTQHLEFSLLSESQVGELIDHVVSDAGLEITPEDRSYVVRAGGGSARDTLSALDQVIAAGGAPQGGEHLDALFQALINRDGGAGLAAIDGALQAGRDAASIATALLHELRTVFLAAMRADIGHLPEAEANRANERAAGMSPARVTRAIEVIGSSIIEMRQAPDPRVDLEVAVMRLTRADLDTDPAAIVERLSAIESQLSGGAPIPAPVPTQAAPAPQESAPASVADQATPVEPVPAAQPTAATPDPVAPSAPEQAAPQTPAPAPQAAPAPQGQSAGRRGAQLVREELAKQGISPPPSQTAPAPGPAAATQQAAPVQPAAAPAASTGKTLADVRRERQAAAQAAGGQAPAAPAETADVAAAAEARRERQAAAQAAPPERAAAPQQAPPASESAPVAPEQAPPASESAPTAPQQAPAPSPEPTATAEPVPPAAPEPTASPAQSAPATPGGAVPTKDELNAVWQPLLETMSGRVRSRFSAGHFMDSTADSAQFGLPNPVHRDRCEEIRAEVDQAIAAKFGRPVPLALVVDEIDEEPDFLFAAAPPSGGAGAVDEAEAVRIEEETVDVHALVDATGDIPSAEDRLLATFEGSRVVEEPPTPNY